jgi:hypothetical protein
MASVSWISPPAPGLHLFEQFEDAAVEHVATDDGERARRVFGLGLLDDRADATVATGEIVGGHDAVAAGLVARDFLHGEHAGAGVGRVVDHLLECARAAVPDQVVGQQDGERLIADHFLRAQHRMSQAQALRPA